MKAETILAAAFVCTLAFTATITQAAGPLPSWNDGKVLQKNLGEKTAEIAAKIDVYDPDGTWTPDQV